jgi:hypothetical protein
MFRLASFCQIAVTPWQIATLRDIPRHPSIGSESSVFKEFACDAYRVTAEIMKAGPVIG